MRRFIAHYFIPHYSNNFRARLLHHKILSILLLFFFVSGFFLQYLQTTHPDILGVYADISVEELLLLTNQKRAENGAAPLSLDNRLSQAAAGKAMDMFFENYWAHNSPSGKTPWVFIRNAGYSYVFAGENLAKGFSNSQDVINAWMASPDHRKNMLSGNYKNVGFAIEKGRLNGEETILIVEMFGNEGQKTITSTTVNSPKSPINTIPTTVPVNPASEPVLTLTPTISPPMPTSVENKEDEKILVAGLNNPPAIRSNSTAKNIALFIIVFLIVLFLLDLIIIEKRKIVRGFKHHVDHIMFLTLVLILIIVMFQGSIL